MLKMRPAAKGIYHLWRWPLNTAKKRIYAPCFEWDEKNPHCELVKVMASSHHGKPVTIIEMHQTHPENLPLPVLPPPLHPLYFALSFPPSYNCFLLDIGLQSCCHLFGLIAPSSPPVVFLLPCFFVLPALLKLSVMEQRLNHILIRGNISSGEKILMY